HSKDAAALSMTSSRFIRLRAVVEARLVRSAPRSAALTQKDQSASFSGRARNSVRGNSLSSWLNMLVNPLTGEPPWWWRVEACRPRHHHTPGWFTRSHTLVWTRVIHCGATVDHGIVDLAGRLVGEIGWRDQLASELGSQFLDRALVHRTLQLRPDHASVSAPREDTSGSPWRRREVGRCPPPSRRQGSRASLNGLRLAIEEVIHHDDVMLPLIVWPRGHIAARDPHAGDARVVEDDAKEGQACIARRGRDEAAEEQIAVDAEVLDQRARLAISALLAGSAPVGLVNVGEDRAEATDHCRHSSVGAGYEEQSVGDVAAHRGEQALRAEGAEDRAVG